ncbi:MAG: VCBS repeat-containing protein [Saprospiraceae bacterium]|nr:VCBS repeat-containing protein [Saprospiraceae bacterium]
MSPLFFQKTCTVACLLLSSVMCVTCNKGEKKPALFQLLRKETTGLDFENVLHQSGEFNVFNYMYFFNGGGVGAGDFNNDGRTDLYFTSNMGPNKMFLNEGNLKFKDVTEQAGVAGMEGWTSGVSIVDLNNDGMLDLYVGQIGEYQSIKGRNQLFICKGIENGVPRYEDEAIYYSLDLKGFSTQAAFFDYDLDGDLDMFQLNHSLHQNGTFGPKKAFDGQLHPLAGDKLLRNDKGKFVDVTAQSGILSTVIGYGLGIVTGDLNNDGYPDIYIGNDFHENDYLYLNQGDGTFKELITEEMMHTSQFSMGVDMADINNDGWSDVISLDMLPEDPFILKSSLGEDNFSLYQYKIGHGYHYQYARNNLQLNNGDGTFSEIGLFAGIAATDWSWSPLWMDFDSDGFKDLFVSNGIPRRMNDIDFVKFQEDRGLQLKENSTRSVEEKELEVVDKMPRVKLPNKLFRNTGKLHFDDLTDQIGDGTTSFSNGAVYADLDNDGDLDVVTNNLEDEPFIYKNLFRENSPATASFLSFQLKGQPENRNGIGAKVLIFKKDGSLQTEEFYPVRGYQSSAHTPLFIGVGDPSSIDSVVCIWPDKGYQRVSNLQFNTTQTLTWVAGLPVADFAKIYRRETAPFAFADISVGSGLAFRHKENPFIEFNRETLIPNMVSTEGPALAVGDVTGDGLEDVFFGSSKREPSALYRQMPNGRFVLQTPAAILQDSIFEDVDAVFADLENDGDLDLVVAAGGNEYRGKDDAMKQRAYLNDGKGNFSRTDPFPTLFMTASCVLPCDVNGDGLTDFFFGGRALPWNYGITPNSYLMQNMGNGRFEDVTSSLAPGLSDIGLVKNGTWSDMDSDGDQDLLLALEWDVLTVFVNNQGKLEKKPLASGKGWWNFVLPYDFDGDGDVDILAGNTGKNSRLKPSATQPLHLFTSDFDANGQVEQLLTYYVKDREIPFASHEELIKALPVLKKKYLLSKDFAKASIEELLGKDNLDKAVLRVADSFESAYFENTGQGFTYSTHALPDALQFSPLMAAALQDLDGDGKKEVILGGNFYECNVEMGRYDAFYGKVLSIGKQGQMSVAPLGDLLVKGQTRRIEPVKIANKPCLVFARNNAAAMVIEVGDNRKKTPAMPR